MKKKLSEVTEAALLAMSAEDKWNFVCGDIKDGGESGDYALLLGSRPVYARERALAAAELYRAGRVRYIVPSGGVEWDTDGEMLSEALYMTRILTENGVPESAIILENEATTTRENMIYGALQINRRTKFKGNKHVVIVTSQIHMQRSIALAKAFLPRCTEVSSYPSYPALSREEQLASPEYLRMLDNAIHLTKTLLDTGVVEDLDVTVPDAVNASGTGKMEITGAIFDMDGTIVDSLPFWDVFWPRLGARYLNDPTFQPEAEAERSMRTMTLRALADRLHEEYGFAESGEELFRVADEMCERFYEEEVEMKAGAIEFLEHCKRRGIKMCIASASAMNLIDIAMRRFNLHRFFPRVISCIEVGCGKDRPDVFIAAHEYLGTAKESTWVFEDSIVAIETSVKAGYKTVGIFDRNGFEQDRLRALSTEYIAEGETLERLIPEI